MQTPNLMKMATSRSDYGPNLSADRTSTRFCSHMYGPC